MQQWRKLDERPYLLEGVGNQKLETSSEVGDGVEQSNPSLHNFLLSSSEGESTGIDTEDDQPSRKKLKLDITSSGDGEGGQDDEFIDDGSPLTIDQDEWADIDAELKEFMGSEVDSESDTDSVGSALSFRERRAAKRRREDFEDEGGSIGDSPKSKRKAGGSGLKSVFNIDSQRNSETSSTPGARDTDERIERDQQRIEAAQEDEEVEEEDSDDELARELERELDEADAELETSRILG